MVKILELNGRNLVNYAGEFAGSQERPRDLETQAAIKVLRVQAESSDSDQSPPPLRPTLSTSHPLFLSPTDTNVSPNAVTEVD